MSHRILLALQLLVALGLVALSLVWPQGQGARSPAPFGHPLAAPERVIRIGDRPVATLRGEQTPSDAPAARQP